MPVLVGGLCVMALGGRLFALYLGQFFTYSRRLFCARKAFRMRAERDLDRPIWCPGRRSTALLLPPLAIYSVRLISLVLL